MEDKEKLYAIRRMIVNYACSYDYNSGKYEKLSELFINLLNILNKGL
nr:hypothetical protein [Clostridia bacterium]